jgi:hypothetical protein
MHAELCNEYRNIPGLREMYGGSFIDQYDIYLVDNFPTKNPRKVILGAINLEKKKIGIREDLIGWYEHVYVDKTLKVDDKLVKVKGYVPVPLFEKTLYHEFRHALHPEEQSEEKIDDGALEDYLENYIRKNLSSYVNNAERKIREYVV